MAIRIEGYNHVGIVVKDLEKCKQLYGGILGLKPIERPPFNFPGEWYQVGQDMQLHLMVLDEEIPLATHHIALEVKDFEKTLAHLKEKGIEIVDGPGKRPDGSDFLFFRDTDGNLVELTRH